MVFACTGENTAMAEILHNGVGPGNGRAFAEGPAYSGATSGVGPCIPQSNATNVANPSFNLPIIPGTQTPGGAPPTVASAKPPAQAAPQAAPAAAPQSTPSQSQAVQKPAPRIDDGGDESIGKGGEKKPGDASLIAAGEKAFSKNCVDCHKGKDADPAKAIDAINHKPGTKPMPQDSELDKQDKDAIIAYLESLRK